MRSPIRPGAVAAALMVLAMTALPMSVAAADASPDASNEDAAALTQDAFHDEMRRLWEDHIIWTRLYIVSAASGPEDLPDIGPTTDRLLANQADIGDAVKPFYGNEAGEALTALLNDHILIAAEAVGHAKAGAAEALDETLGRWYANGDDIAAFLSAANPEHWPLEMMQLHMRSHLDLTLDEVVARLEGRYADEVIAFDRVHADILGMADMLSDGIIAQFPDAFAA